MIVLGINTSTLEGSIALFGEQGLIGEYTLNIHATHSERLVPGIDRLMQDTGLAFSDLSGIAVAIGPGSFTGLRIGLASAKGLALASSLPLWGISTLEALARNLPFCIYPICPMLNARRKEIFWALYRFEGSHLRPLEEEAVSPPDKVIENVQEKTVFLGDGAILYGDRLRERLGDRFLLAPLSLMNIRASQVAEMGMVRGKMGEADDPITLSPRYIRRSEVEIKWGVKVLD